MQKITEIKETRYRTVREKDALGNRTTKKVAYIANREVKVISGGKRFAHGFIDWLIFDSIYQLLSVIFSYFTIKNFGFSFQIVLGIFSIGLFFTFMYPIYYIVFEHFFQKTPGKFVTNCRVIDIYGNKPSFATNFLRNIIRLVPFEIFSCLFSERGWHDRWSDTFVVPDSEYRKIQELLKEIQEKTETAK